MSFKIKIIRIQETKTIEVWKECNSKTAYNKKLKVRFPQLLFNRRNCTLPADSTMDVIHYQGTVNKRIISNKIVIDFGWIESLYDFCLIVYI